jgi:hypothetical protein
MPSLGKYLGVVTRLLKKRRSGCKFRIQNDTRRGEMLLFLTGMILLKLMKII